MNIFLYTIYILNIYVKVICMYRYLKYIIQLWIISLETIPVDCCSDKNNRNVLAVVFTYKDLPLFSEG